MDIFRDYGCKLNYMEYKIVFNKKKKYFRIKYEHFLKESIRTCLKLYSHDSTELILLYYKLFNLVILFSFKNV